MSWDSEIQQAGQITVPLKGSAHWCLFQLKLSCGFSRTTFMLSPFGLQGLFISLGLVGLFGFVFLVCFWTLDLMIESVQF